VSSKLHAIDALKEHRAVAEAWDQRIAFERTFRLAGGFKAQRDLLAGSAIIIFCYARVDAGAGCLEV
jgi:hypothetical protein